jgi:hypothetical protein
MSTDPHIGVSVRDYVIKEKIGSGGIGTVYKAVRSSPYDVMACKIITEGRLKSGWQTEIKKNVRLRQVPNVVPFHMFDSALDHNSRPFTYVLFDFIDGWNLRDYCKEHGSEITLAFVETLTRTILRVLHACRVVGFSHGDLHAGNILVQRPDARLPGSPITLWIADFGYGGSLNNVQPKDDYRQTAALTANLLRSLDPTNLTARDKLTREKLLLFSSKDLLEHDSTQGKFVSDAVGLLERMDELTRQAEAEAAAAVSNMHSQDPADYLSAEALGNRRDEWQRMFVPNFLASDEILSRNITILTGARGCGKTMAFRRLTKFMDETVGAPSGVRGADQFIGFYMNCRDLAEAFPWLPRSLSPAAAQQLLQYFHLNWLAEVLRTVAVADQNTSPDYSWLWTFMGAYFPGFGQRYQGMNALNLARGFVEEQKEACRLERLGRSELGDWPLARVDFLDCLQEALETHVSWARDLPFFFFLDDYTIPLVPSSVQRVLNPAIFRRRDRIFFKISTEATNSFDLSGLRNKPLELQQDFQLVDLATASLHQPLKEKLELLESIFRPRIDRHYALTGKGIALGDLLGAKSFNNTEMARQMREAAQSQGKRTILYHGLEAFAGLWTSDFRSIIQVFVDMLRESPDFGAAAGSGVPMIDAKIQDKVVKAKGGEFINFVEDLANPDQWTGPIAKRKSAVDYGRHLRDIIEAFIAICRWELTHGQLVSNEGRLSPRQAFRLEVIDRFELPPEVLPYYAGLIRWHLFLQDWRGKSARGMLTPRLFLNRILLPYGNLTFSTHDNMGLTNAEFIRLLQSPTSFPRYWKLKRAKKTKHLNQPGFPFSDEDQGDR